MPIPGTSTHRRRVEADGIFGGTFGSTLVSSDVSMNRIKKEMADTVKDSQKFPAYEQARAARIA